MRSKIAGLVACANTNVNKYTYIHALYLGQTPNPDVLCNRAVKFGAFYDFARGRLKSDYIATGHYARTTGGAGGTCSRNHNHNNGDGDTNGGSNTNGCQLLRGVDPMKDQSYFLAGLRQSVLKRTLFPLGGMLKPDVKAVATNLGLPAVAAQKESMGICFVGKRRLGAFLDQYIEQGLRHHALPAACPLPAPCPISVTHALGLQHAL